MLLQSSKCNMPISVLFIIILWLNHLTLTQVYKRPVTPTTRTLRFHIIASECSEQADLVVSRARYFYIYVSRCMSPYRNVLRNSKYAKSNFAMRAVYTCADIPCRCCSLAIMHAFTSYYAYTQQMQTHNPHMLAPHPHICTHTYTSKSSAFLSSSLITSLIEVNLQIRSDMAQNVF